MRDRGYISSGEPITQLPRIDRRRRQPSMTRQEEPLVSVPPPLPPNPEPTLQDAGHTHDSSVTKFDYRCTVHAHHEWVPLNHHHVWPKGMGGPDIVANKITVCTNGHYMIHEYIRQLIAHAGNVPNALKIHFGLKVREYGKLGWEKAGKPSRGTVGE